MLNRKPKRSTTATTLLIGAAAGAILTWAPIASADDPPPSTDPSQQQQPPVDPAGIVGSVADQLNQGSGGQSQVPAISPYPTSGPPGGVCMRMNGFPIYIPPGGIPSDMAASGVPSGPVHAGNCTSKDSVVPVDAVQRGSDAAGQIAGAANPQQNPSDQQEPPPPGQ